MPLPATRMIALLASALLGLSAHVSPALPRTDCPPPLGAPMPTIVRNARTALYAATITVHAGAIGDCIAPLPDGIMLTAGGGTAPQIAHQGRAVFRISGTGIDGPGGINIGVSASPISADVPETEDLHSAAFLSLPPNAVLVRYDPFSNSCIKAATGPRGSILRQWGLYKVLRPGAPCTPQPAAPAQPATLPATGSGALIPTIGVGTGVLLVGGGLTVVGLSGGSRTRRRRQLRRGAVLMGGALVVLVAGATALYGRDGTTAVGFGSLTEQGPLPRAPGATMPPDRLVVDRLGVDTTVIPLAVVNGAWQVPSYAAGYLVGGARPGEQGNLSIAAHDDQDGAIFQRLGDLRAGDIVRVYAEGHAYRYALTGLGVVPASAVSVTRPTRGATLTLITCTPYGIDTARLVARARLLQ